MDPERIAQVLAVGTNHAQVETAGDLDSTMATLVPDPVYEFCPVRRSVVPSRRSGP